MQKQFLFLFITLMILTKTEVSIAQDNFKKPSNKMLVVSGGGARGAWGVGVASELFRTQGGYKAVFGTSTGSLMSSFILLQKFEELQKAYSSVTQKDIFSVNPFKVTYDKNTKTVKTKIRAFKMIRRMIFGKKTLGETENLLKLIKKQLTPQMFADLIAHAKRDSMIVGVAVTNMRTGRVSLMTDSLYENTDAYYDSLCRWIWASANEPLFMSYTMMGGSPYVDGGVRRVIPVEEAVRYSISHGIDTVDIIVNNARIPEDQNWNVNSGGIMEGLKRLLSVYNFSTVQYNENHAYFLKIYHDCARDLPLDPFGAPVRMDSTILRFYFMPEDIAMRYADELGFIQEAMQELIKEGKDFVVKNPNGVPLKVDDMVDRKSKKFITN